MEVIINNTYPIPNCLVLTVPKTGSTSLSETLLEHPDICMPLSKETWFFQEYYESGVDTLREKFSHWQGEQIICDFVSTLIYEKGFTSKIQKYFKNPKIIYLIRDPVQRCISHYLHEVRRGLETETMDKALDLENSRLKSHPEKYSHQAYRHIGTIYKTRLEELYEIYPKNSVHVLLLEELIQNQKFSLSEIWEYLGIENCVDISLKHTNKARMPRNNKLHKILSFPSNVFQFIQNNPSLNSLVPLALKRKTRILRSGVGRSLNEIKELSFKEINRPEIQHSLITDLQDFYRAQLQGFDVLSNKDLVEFWPWWK